MESVVVTEPVIVDNMMSDVRDMLVSKLREGYTVTLLARENGLSYRLVRELAIKNNIPLVRGRRMGQTDTLKLERNQQIIEDLRRGVTMAECARIYGMSRERVRQLALKEGFTARTNKDFQREENLKLLQPFLEIVEDNVCQGCGEREANSRSGLRLCIVCQSRRDKVRTVSSRLKTYLQTGNTIDLSQAAWIVREYGVTPEEMRKYQWQKSTR